MLDIPETLPRVRADAGLLERAVANVVDNARAWSPTGQVVKVSAGARQRWRPAAYDCARF